MNQTNYLKDFENKRFFGTIFLITIVILQNERFFNVRTIILNDRSMRKRTKWMENER